MPFVIILRETDKLKRNVFYEAIKRFNPKLSLKKPYLLRRLSNFLVIFSLYRLRMSVTPSAVHEETKESISTCCDTRFDFCDVFREENSEIDAAAVNIEKEINLRTLLSWIEFENCSHSLAHYHDIGIM